MADVEVRISAKGLQGRVRKAQIWLKNEALKDTEPFVPALSGTMSKLAKAATAKAPDNEIIYPGPYARFLWRGKVMIYPPTGSTYAPKHGRKVVTEKDLVFSKEGAQKEWFLASKEKNIKKWRDGVAKMVAGG
jgi:hypothetical protein